MTSITTSATPLVSVIVPTKNSSQFLKNCLLSIKKQSYKNIEIIVIDNFSNDDTMSIARRYADYVEQKGPERSAQRNYGVSKAKGQFVTIIDSDMELSEGVIEECVDAISQADIRGVIIPEESFGVGFWAQCKKLERSFYVGIDWMEAARFFRKEDYVRLGGYNESLISGEDWDLSNRIRTLGAVTRISSFIYHNEGRINLRKTLSKKSYYASNINSYVKANTESTSTGAEISKVFKRFGLYFSHPLKLFKNPFLGIGMLFMKVSEFGFGFIGWAFHKR